MARAVLQKLKDVEVLEVGTALGNRNVGIARFQTPVESSLTRTRIVYELAKRNVYVYSLERSDLGLESSLRLLAKTATKADRKTVQLTSHRTAKRLLHVLAILRGFRREVHSANSSFAVTPLVEDLIRIVDVHVALLEARGVELDAAANVKVECIKKELAALPTSVRTASTWSSSGKKLAAAARVIEIPAFEHYVATLRTVAADAAGMAKKLAGRARGRAKARAQHVAQAEHAGQLATLLDRAHVGMRLSN